jgi:putative endonuclease
MRAKDRLGRSGEDLAEAHLRAAGLTVLARNWRSTERSVPGELDIVARDGAALVFCEVKTRRGDGFGAPAEAISAAKLRRLRRLSRVWLAAHPHGGGPIRFDVVAVLAPPDGPARITHLAGIR